MSRSWVNAAAHRLPSGQGTDNATGRRPALAITAARRSVAARETTGSAARPAWTTSFACEGTRS